MPTARWRGNNNPTQAAVFYAVGTAGGGIVAPWLLGVLIGSGERLNAFHGCLPGAVLMYVAAAAGVRYGVRAERVSLEAVAPPLPARPQ